jgi:methionyl-tRNA formyltransferase
MVAPSLRIVFFGTPDFAVPTLRALLDSPADVVAVVSQPDRPRGRGQRTAATPTKELAVLRGVPVLQPARLRAEEFLSAIAALRPDLGVVAAYGRILPDALLAIPRLGLINVHGSLLPKYRGAAPVHRAVIAGEAVTGISIMRVVQELDAGPVLAMRSRPIGPDDTSAEVERDLAELGASLLMSVLEAVARGEIVETPQDDAQATYAPKIQKTEGPIDWSLPAARIHNLVRGLQPWPLASTTIAGVRCLIHRTAVPLPQPPNPESRIPDPGRRSPPGGTVVHASGDTLAVVAGDGLPIELLGIQPEGRRVMTAREFLSGHRVGPGDRLTSP